jgi:hypothetical protein
MMECKALSRMRWEVSGGENHKKFFYLCHAGDEIFLWNREKL